MPRERGSWYPRCLRESPFGQRFPLAMAKESACPELAEHVEALSTALAAFGKLAREAINESDELGDVDTSDLFTEVSRGIDKWLWFVEAHLQAER